MFSNVVVTDVLVDVLVVCVVVVVVLVPEDIGKPTQSTMIVLKQILANKMPTPSAIFGYLRFTLFNHIMRKFLELWGGLGGGIDGGGGSVVWPGISSYRPS